MASQHLAQQAIRLVRTALLAAALSLPAAAGASELPEYYPTGFRLVGTLQRIDTSRNLLVLDDIRLPYSPNFKVHTLNTEFGTIHNLRPGLRIGIKLVPGRNGRPMVSEVWVLPKDYRQHFRITPSRPGGGKS